MTTPAILIVEDDPGIRAMLLSALRRESLRVDVAADGVEALEKVQARHFALIIVDLMMPRMDGYEFVEELRKMRKSPRPIVFVMTAVHDDSRLYRLAPDTVQAFIRKPFDLSLLVELVRDCADVAEEDAARHRDDGCREDLR